MRRVNLKSGLVIIIYSLILSSILGFGIYSIKGSFNSVENQGKAIMIKPTNLDSEDSLYRDIGNVSSFSMIEENREVAYRQILTYGEIVDLDEIGKDYLSSGFKDITITISKFFLIFIIASFLLWKILNKMHDKEIENIVKNLNSLDEDFNPYSVSTPFGIAYENIKEKFKQNLDDYKKLNSYLSHEQKNAIAILRTNLEIDDNKEYIKLLDNIADSIDDILTLSDLKAEGEMSKIDLSLICASVCDTYKKTYKNIDFDFDDENSTTILAKERWIYRAVSNLVDNAVKYGSGKTIRVSVKNKYNSVIIEVEDNGIGMDRNLIENIFNNKYRINNLKKDGYGIGLSLVSHVCDLCNGVIIVDSEINKGSCFYLSFSEYKE